MKKRTEIQQDLKRGFGSAPTGIKILVKWLLVSFMVYVAVVVFLIRTVWRILSAILFLSVLLLFIILFCVIL